MRRFVAAVLSATALAIPITEEVAAANAATVKPKKRVVVVTRHVTGSQAQADRWGVIEITLTVRKTTTTVGKRKTVVRRITGIGVPLYPNHTDRSVFINQQALPYLQQEVLQAQMNPNIQLVSGATATSFAFEQSLQAALLAAKKI